MYYESDSDILKLLFRGFCGVIATVCLVFLFLAIEDNTERELNWNRYLSCLKVENCDAKTYYVQNIAPKGR